MTPDDDLVRILSAIDSAPEDEPPPYAAEMLVDLHSHLAQRLSHTAETATLLTDELRLGEEPGRSSDLYELLSPNNSEVGGPTGRFTDRSRHVLLVAATAAVIFGLAVIFAQPPQMVVSGADSTTGSTIRAFDAEAACAAYNSIDPALTQLEDDVRLESADVARVDSAIAELDQLLGTLRASGLYEDSALGQLTIGRATLVQARAEVGAGLNLQAARTVRTARRVVELFDIEASAAVEIADDCVR